MEYYWHIELYSGEIIKVKPDPQKITAIQTLIAKQEGAITTPTRSIVIKAIKDFRLSDEPYTDQKLLEDVAQAFREPLYTEDAISSRWVKKSVPRRRWDTHYSKIPSYRLLEDNYGTVTIAFILPVHAINLSLVQYVNAAEEIRLEQWR